MVVVVVEVVVGRPTSSLLRACFLSIQPPGQHWAGPCLLDAQRALVLLESLVLPSGSLGRASPGTPEP